MGKKKSIIYIIIAVVTIGLLMFIQYNKPKKLNWFPSYVAQHKIPYGTKVLNDLLEGKFTKLQQVTSSSYQFLIANQDAKGTYFFVNSDIKFDQTELNHLLDWTASGNTLFIASNNFDDTLLDTLELKTSGLYDGLVEEKGQLHQLVHPQLKKEKGFAIQKDTYTRYFSEIDTAHTTVIGTVDHYNENKKIETDHFNVISKSFGNGKIILSTFPKAFTNYFILKDSNKDYTAGLLSYIDTDTTLFIDNNLKAGKAFYTSPMHVFLNNKALKWAYYLALIGALIYVVFEGKRKQRAIPVVHPLKNQSLAFTRTIADMYFEKKEQRQIANHKINYFLEYIRSRFHLNTQDITEAFCRNLAARSNHSIEEVSTLFTFLNSAQNNARMTDSELIKLNTAIEQFKVRADGRK